jgi:hypothetical protein
LGAVERSEGLHQKQLCLCCGLEDEENLRGPYEQNPYKIVCERCWSKPFLHFPDKVIGKDGLSYAAYKNGIKTPRPRLWNADFDRKDKNVLMVEPNYYTRYPPIGLLKLSSFHKSRGDSVKLVRYPERPKKKPDIIYVTSLFTYSWREVHEAVGYYKRLFPQTRLVLGGIYASLLPDHAMLSGADYVQIGLVEQAENLKPDYSLLRKTGWDSNILFSSRGCIRKCGFCAVPKLEGYVRIRGSITDRIHRRLKKIVLWDNNVLSTPGWRDVFDELEEIGFEVDFNQGFDARLINQEVAERISRLKIKTIRISFDNSRDKRAVGRAISLLSEVGVRKREIIAYTLYNYTDTPDDFLRRVKQLLEWGTVSYPMRYEPLCALIKNKYTSPKWSAPRLDLVQKARRVIGYAGAFPPYAPLIKKLSNRFNDAFELRPSIQEIRRELECGKDEVELVYAYYRKHNLTTKKLPLKEALSRISSDIRGLADISNERSRRKRQKRLGGPLDWRKKSIRISVPKKAESM